MPLDSPLDSAMHYAITGDTSQIVKQLDIMDAKIAQSDQHIQELTKSLSSFERTAGGVGGFFGGIAKWAGGVITVMETLLTYPAKLSNYMGTVNQRVTQVGDQLERYRKITTEIHAIHEGAMAGVSIEDRNKIISGLVAGETLAEKYGPGARERAMGFGAGAGLLVRGGFGADESAALMTSLRKQTGLVSAEMEGYAKQLLAVSRTSNMTNAEFARSTQHAIGLARAYGLVGAAAQNYVLSNLRVSSAVSQMGLDVESTMRKMNEVASGSEEGLLQSLLMGFNPNEPEAQMAGFQNMAQRIVGGASGMDPRFQPFFIRQMADSLGMKQFAVEDLQKMAKGISVEGAGKTEQQQTIDLLRDIKGELGKPEIGKESPFFTVQNTLNNVTSLYASMMETKFWNTLKDFQKDMNDNAPKWIGKLSDAFDKLDSILKKYLNLDSSKFRDLLTTIGGGTGALGILGGAASIGMGILPSILVKRALAGGAAGGLAGTGSGLGGPGMAAVGGLEATAAASLTAIAGTILLGLAIGGTLGFIVDKITDMFPSLKKAKEKLSDAIVSTPVSIEGAFIEGQDISPVPAVEELSKTKIGKAAGLGIKGTKDETLKNLIAKKAEEYSIPVELLSNLIGAESSFNTKAVGHDKIAANRGYGLGQTTLGTAQMYDKSITQPSDILNDVNKQLDLTAHYLHDQLITFKGDAAKAVAAYNAGPGNVRKAVAKAEKEGGSWVNDLPHPEITGPYLTRQGMAGGKGPSLISDPEGNEQLSKVNEKLSRLITISERQYQKDIPAYKTPIGPDPRQWTLADQYSGVGA